jgi:hypothetical protein
MPTVFPTLDPATGELVDETYYYATEAAARLHVSPRTLEKRCQAGKWPHLKIVGNYYFSAAHIARIVEIETVDPDAAEEPPPLRPRLGVVMDDGDIDGLGGVR